MKRRDWRTSLRQIIIGSAIVIGSALLIFIASSVSDAVNVTKSYEKDKLEIHKEIKELRLDFQTIVVFKENNRVEHASIAKSVDKLSTNINQLKFVMRTTNKDMKKTLDEIKESGLIFVEK